MLLRTDYVPREEWPDEWVDFIERIEANTAAGWTFRDRRADERPAMGDRGWSLADHGIVNNGWYARPPATPKRLRYYER